MSGLSSLCIMFLFIYAVILSFAAIEINPHWRMNCSAGLSQWLVCWSLVSLKDDIVLFQKGVV